MYVCMCVCIFVYVKTLCMYECMYVRTYDCVCNERLTKLCCYVESGVRGRAGCAGAWDRRSLTAAVGDCQDRQCASSGAMGRGLAGMYICICKLFHVQYVCIYMYVCIYVRMCVCMYICMYIHSIHTCIHVCIYTAYIHVYVHINIERAFHR